MSILLLRGDQHWVCPNCTTTVVTRGMPNRFHDCPGLKGLQAPMVLEGTACKIEANERDDYIGKEVATVDGDGRPMMNVITTRDDGQDCTVYAPLAKVTLE